ncbi:MAG: coproporphyrinogen dehydrogenase HemZ [Clostridia bacterium]|nr:coproporphyrinogen dehydrogenase HemZ [Clostridia bacterium]MBP3583328.1 coproporphyrinogen dehydrogenase HemZ [Clostridia bacterium]
MILKVNGNINRYYVETLCMVFFPGSTFGENEEPREGVPEITVDVSRDKSGKAVASYVSIKLNDRVCEATETVSLAEEISISTHESIAVGRAMFAAGKEMLGHTPPWGILTGVRPAKVARGLLFEGRGILKTKRAMRDEYFLNPQKAALAVSVASTEMKIMKRLPKNTCSIYISIPFCPTRCAYCSFVSYTTPRLLSMISEYLDALIIDLLDTFDTVRRLGMTVSTVYIGGGTPTTLSAEELRRLLSVISENIDVSTLLEFTLEAGRPDTITADKLRVAKEYGVTRISVNPQTLSDDILREIGRRHTVSDFYDAYEIAKASGIKDINVDLIAGLPGDDFKNFSETVDKVIELMPTNITVHTFSVKKASDALKNNSGVYSISGGDAAKSISYSQIQTKFAGYKPYYMYRQKNTVGNLENVGFALEGHEGLYNILMMEEVQTIFAVGAGAVTKLVREATADSPSRIERLFRPKYPYEYLRKDKDGEDLRKKHKEKIFAFFGKEI